jgi:ribosome-binding factor A
MSKKKKGIFAELQGEPVVPTSEDGLDPREVAKRRRRERQLERPGQAHGLHKQEQFLSQVRSAIESALQTAATPVLNTLFVEEVIPQGGSLHVVVLLPASDGPPDIAGATRALEQAAPMLRREVASAITRKETPNLSFVVLPPGAQRVDE